jgi:hypothetical protein
VVGKADQLIDTQRTIRFDYTSFAQEPVELGNQQVTFGGSDLEPILTKGFH